MLLGQRLEQTDQPLGDVRMKRPELPGHVGQGRQAIGVQILVAHFHHVVLDGANHDQDEETAQRDLGNRAFRVPGDVLQELRNERTQIRDRFIWVWRMMENLQFDGHSC